MIYIIVRCSRYFKGFPGGSDSKASACSVGHTQVQSLGWEDPLEKEMAAHSSTLAWKIPWKEEPGRLGSQSWILSDFTSDTLSLVGFVKLVCICIQELNSFR